MDTVNTTLDTTAAALWDLAEARGIASHAASELNIVLGVWGSQMPSGAVKALTALQTSLSGIPPKYGIHGEIGQKFYETWLRERNPSTLRLMLEDPRTDADSIAFIRSILESA